MIKSNSITYMNSKNTADIFAKSIVHTLWIHSMLFATIVYVILVEYIFIQKGYLNIFFLNEAIAGTASIMIGISFAFSGFGYYFDFLDTKIAYRKYFGLIGFWYAFLYTFILAVLNPQKYVYGLFIHFWSVDIILGCVALMIFTFMALISTRWAMRRMGVVYWRRGLRLGYFAYILLIIRAVIIEGDMWRDWFAYPHSLPPVRLLGSIFAGGVLFFRGSMIISDFFHKRKNNSTV